MERNPRGPGREIATSRSSFRSDHPGRRIASGGISRLALYYRALLSLGGRPVVSSEELGEATGYTGDQVRRDLTAFGSFGVPGMGYSVAPLRDAIGRILGKGRTWKVALIGAGQLGSALLGYGGFRKQGFEFVVACDSDPAKIGRPIGGVPVLAAGEMTRVVKEWGVELAVVTVPAPQAQDVVSILVEVGVRGILNFAPSLVTAPAAVVVQNVDLSVQLDRLAFLVANRLSRSPA